jgi:hypothetical protein
MDDDSRDQGVSLEGLDPVAALKALLAVDPGAPPANSLQDDSEPAAQAPNRRLGLLLRAASVG